MNSSSKKLMAAVLVAIGASAFGASAQTANTDLTQSQAFDSQLSSTPSAVRNYPVAGSSVASAAPRANTESRQFEEFENHLSVLSAPSYTPSEHPNAPPAPRSRIQRESPFSSSDLASPGG
jgi:hypothetical protein